jgi:hypothetical protein
LLVLLLYEHEKEKNQKKNLGLMVYASVPLHKVYASVPLRGKIEIACSFALHVGKRKGPRKIYFSLGVDCHPRTT